MKLNPSEDETVSDNILIEKNLRKRNHDEMNNQVSIVNINSDEEDNLDDVIILGRNDSPIKKRKGPLFVVDDDDDEDYEDECDTDEDTQFEKELEQRSNEKKKGKQRLSLKVKQFNNNRNNLISLNKSPQVITILSSDEEEDDDDEIIFNSSVNKPNTTQIIESKKPEDNYKSMSLYECPICFDSPESTIALPCGHCYCFECLFAAFGHSRTAKKTDANCALCRSSYTLNQTVPLKFKIVTKS